MIKYTLRCEHGHRFEGWFADSLRFEDQARAGHLSCPVCGDSRIERAPMAPRISRSGDQGAAPADARRHVVMAALNEKLKEFRAAVEENCDYVGDRFAEEARKIHYEETEHRDIYGEATDSEAQALTEEGIDFTRIPWVPREN